MHDPAAPGPSTVLTGQLLLVVSQQSPREVRKCENMLRAYLDMPVLPRITEPTERRPRLRVVSSR